MIPTLFVISLLIFLIVQLPPGSYVANELLELRAQGQDAAAARIAFLVSEFDLDRPLLVQYAIWIGIWPSEVRGFSGLLQGDLGWSFAYEQPVAAVVGEAMPLTLLVNVATVAFIYLLAFPIGVYSASRPYSWGDTGFTLLGYIGLATPNFLLGLVLLYYAHAWFGLSIGGLMDPRFLGVPWSAEKALSVAQHLVVPVVVIGTAGTAAIIRRLRANLMDELRKPYVTAAAARGARGLGRLRYPLKVALNPFIADIGNLLPSLVSGAVIVSVVLNLPTIGPVLLEALRSQDSFLAGFILLFVAGLTLAGMLVSDLLLGLVDPRIRFGLREARG
ncbi:MAG: ABC transporter permease [Alphaproteobacteria bacterium]|nr:ABC transporter permease [Alphaproteobacteria bacterium]